MNFARGNERQLAVLLLIDANSRVEERKLLKRVPKLADVRLCLVADADGDANERLEAYRVEAQAGGQHRC